MNVAEYIEHKMDYITFKETVFYHKYAQKVGLTDIRTAKELIELDLKELFKCRFMKHNGTSAIQSCLIEELWFTETCVVIDFSHWIYQLRKDNPHWLSDILQQTRMNNYIVRGE